MKKTVSLTLDKQLLSDIDKIRELIPRSTFINDFLVKSMNVQTLEIKYRRDETLAP